MAPQDAVSLSDMGGGVDGPQERQCDVAPDGQFLINKIWPFGATMTLPLRLLAVEHTFAQVVRHTGAVGPEMEANCPSSGSHSLLETSDMPSKHHRWSPRQVNEHPPPGLSSWLAIP